MLAGEIPVLRNELDEDDDAADPPDAEDVGPIGQMDLADVLHPEAENIINSDDTEPR